MSNAQCMNQQWRLCDVVASPRKIYSKRSNAFANSKYNFGILPVLRHLENTFKSSLKQLIGYRGNRRSQSRDKQKYFRNEFMSQDTDQKCIADYIAYKNDRALAGSTEDKERRSNDLHEFLNSSIKTYRSKTCETALEKDIFFPLTDTQTKKVINN